MVTLQTVGENGIMTDMERKLEILLYNYWEHFKYAKDLHLILPLGHQKRVVLDKELNKMITRIHEINKELKLTNENDY